VLKASNNLKGPVVGGTVGCNYQINQFVVGVEGDLSWADVKGSAFLIGPAFNTDFIHNMRESYFATARGRLGYAAWSDTLFYVTGGAAWAGVEISSQNIVTGLVGATNSAQLHGWTAGGGVEHAFTAHITAKVEYLYAEFSRHNFFEATNGCCTTEATNLRQHVVRVGVNYKF
jgi:outer membrane immunogenic protein